ncbi:MAG: DUF2723 domain-containing protein [Planctomycetota bacterium]|nr:MAG: DUF2723 domain-containing protein [Planctomycetota bacterium]
MQAGMNSERARDGAWYALVVAVLGAAYAVTLLPGVGLGDTAELQTCAARLALPHAPGYPLEVLLLAAFDRLVPFGTSAWRASACNALWMIGAACALLALARRLGASTAAAAGVALAFGLALPVWRNANAVEVYALLLLLLALAFERWLAWGEARERGEPARARLAAALACTALAVVHHPLSMFALPGLALLAWSTDGWSGFARRAALLLVVGVALSAALYGWLAWRWRSPELAYSALRLDTLERAWFQLSGGQFRGRMFGLTFEELLRERAPQFLAVLGRALAWLAPAAIAGWLLPAPRHVRAALLLGALGPALYAATYRIDDIEAYFLPTLLLAFAAAAAALGWCERALRAGTWLAPLAALALAVASLCANFAAADRRPEERDELAARALLESVGHDALLLWPENPQSQLLWHLLLVEGGAERGVHVVHDRDVGALRRYVADGAPLFERHTRRWIPAGLTAYCLSDEIARVLVARGFTLRELDAASGAANAAALARIVAAPGDPKRAAAAR